MATQYSARDKDNVAVSPQPGDVEITDIYGNVFDNFNEYGVVTGTDKSTAKNRLVAFFDKDNVALDPQPGYQNLNYRRSKLECGVADTQPLPDAGNYVFSGLIPGTTRTPEPYEKSPLHPEVASFSSAVVVTLRVEESEGLIVTEDDVSGIRLAVNHADYESTRNYDS